jgi:hypothetical protein
MAVIQTTITLWPSEQIVCRLQVSRHQDSSHNREHALASLVHVAMVASSPFVRPLPLWVFPCAQLSSFKFSGMKSFCLDFVTEKTLRLDGMTMTYVWYESYEAVVLETDWTKMHERIQSAESKINDRKRVLSLDHGGTPEERQAIANALNAMGTLRTEVDDWQSRQAPQAERRRDHV